MVKITNNVNEFVVSKGAFKDIFENLGYKIVDEGVPVDLSADAPENEDENNENEEEVSLLEKPISQWSKAEMLEFAQQHNIEIDTEKTSPKEVRKIIKDYIDSEN